MPSEVTYLEQGPPGPAGPAGEPGPVGPPGPPGGPAGPQGPAGPAGSVGPQGPQGAQGPAGPKGNAGADGAPGAPGPQGPQGLKGDKGDKGADGAVGPQGPDGVAGPAGPTGAAGPQGPQGAEGPQGVQGVAGPIGPKGDKGDAGVAGAQGIAGPQGPAGAKGDKGDTGAAGPQGLPGAQGPAGVQGVAGPVGPEGVAGPQGPAGPKGDKGDAGAIGPEGLPGVAGPQGAPGAAGAKGDKGDPGVPGAAGPAGLQGAQGLQGPIGPTGTQGPKGDKGDTGAAGAAGAPGVQGVAGAIGPQGPKGDKGDTGATGPAGPAGPAGAGGSGGTVSSLILPVVRGLSDRQLYIDMLARDGKDTTSYVPPGDYNPATYAELVAAINAATEGKRIRVMPRSRIFLAAKLPNHKPGVQIESGGDVWFISNFTTANMTQADSCLLPMLADAEGANGAQSIKGIHWLGNDNQASSAAYVRGRSNVLFEDCTFEGFHYAAVTFSGRVLELDSPATIKASGNGLINCVAVGCSTWVGTSTSGYASGIVQYGSQLGFKVENSIIAAKGRPVGQNGYGLKPYRYGYNDSTRVLNSDLRKSWDDATPFNFGFAWECWMDTDILMQDSSMEGCIDMNGVTKGAGTWGARFINNVFGTMVRPANTGVVTAIEFEAGLDGTPCSDVLITHNRFQKIREALYFYQKQGAGTRTFSRITYTHNVQHGCRFAEYVAAAPEGGITDVVARYNTMLREAGDPALNAGVPLPNFGVNARWAVEFNIIQGYTAPINQSWPAQINGSANPAATAMSTLSTSDNIYWLNTSNTPNFAVNTAVTPAPWANDRNQVRNPYFETIDGDATRHALEGIFGAAYPRGAGLDAPSGTSSTTPSVSTSGAAIFGEVGAATPFDQQVVGLRKVREYVFGATAVAGPGQIAITNLQQLAEEWAPYAKTENADGSYLWGAWTGPINNSVVGSYQPFSAGLHKFTADGLLLDVDVAAGQFKMPVFGQMDVNASDQIHINAPGGGTTTIAASRLQITDAELATIRAWELVYLMPWAAGVVSAVDTVAKTVTIECLGNYPIDTGGTNSICVFTHFGFGRLAAPIDNNSQTLTFKNPLPADVSTGWVPRLWMYGSLHESQDTFSVVQSISGDRKSVTLTGPCKFNIGTLDINNGSVPGVMFHPQLRSTQIASKLPFGLGKPGVSKVAWEVRSKSKTIAPNTVPQALYSKSQILAFIAKYPTYQWGNWIGRWLMTLKFKEQAASPARMTWKECDHESFHMPAKGPNVQTANQHRQPFTSDRLVDADRNELVITSTVVGYADGTHLIPISDARGGRARIIVAGGVITSIAAESDFALQAYADGETVFLNTFAAGGRVLVCMVSRSHRILPGARWISTPVTTKDLTPNSEGLYTPDLNVSDGAWHTHGHAQSPNRVVAYIDGTPIKSSNWVDDSPYPYMVIVEQACGSFAPDYGIQPFFPLVDPTYLGLVVQRVTVWENTVA